MKVSQQQKKLKSESVTTSGLGGDKLTEITNLAQQRLTGSQNSCSPLHYILESPPSKIMSSATKLPVRPSLIRMSGQIHWDPVVKCHLHLYRQLSDIKLTIIPVFFCHFYRSAFYIVLYSCITAFNTAAILLHPLHSCFSEVSFA